MNDVISQLVVKRIYTVETSLAGIGSFDRVPVNFTDNAISKLQGKLIYGLEFVSATQQALAASGRPAIPQVDAPNVLLQMVEDKSTDVGINNVVVTRFMPTLYNGYTQYIRPRIFNWTASKYIITQAGTITNAMSLLLMVYWKNPDE